MQARNGGSKVLSLIVPCQRPVRQRALSGARDPVHCGSVESARHCSEGRTMATEKDVRRALRKVKDPELNLDLVVLGLVYDIDVQDTHVKATVSLTSPFCPVAGQILDEAKAAIEGVEGVESAEVELTFQPPWTPDRIDPLIRSSLGI
jgi:metal-sulfur cluster biosynthetic enzyme